MANLPFDQNFGFDTELSITAPFTGVPQLLGTLANIPVILLVKNQSDVSVFFADNSGSTKGTTMVASESFVLDFRSNMGRAPIGGFRINTPLFVTGTGGTGVFKVSIIYAS
jgi:hypothetical protein